MDEIRFDLFVLRDCRSYLQAWLTLADIYPNDGEPRREVAKVMREYWRTQERLQERIARAGWLNRKVRMARIDNRYSA